MPSLQNKAWFVRSHQFLEIMHSSFGEVRWRTVLLCIEGGKGRLFATFSRRYARDAPNFRWKIPPSTVNAVRHLT